MLDMPEELRLLPGIGDPEHKKGHRDIKALSKGTATKEQQINALDYITRVISRANDLAYLPGDMNGSAFFAGRSYVGKHIFKLMKSNVGD